MLNNTKERLGHLLGVESHERNLVGLVFLQAILIGAQNLFTRTAAFAIFLETLSAAELPYIYVASGIVIPLIGIGFAKYQKSRGTNHAYQIALALTVSMLITMRLSLEVEQFQYLLVFTLPILHLTCFRLLSVSLWGTANSVFTLRQSKRLYGLITTGDKVITLVGGLLISTLIDLFQTENLIIISIGAITVAFLNQKRILRASPTAQEPNHNREPDEENSRDTSPAEDELETYKRYGKRLLAIQAGLTALYFSIDNAFLTELRGHYPKASDLAVFLGMTSSATALASIALGAVSGRTIAQKLGTISMLQLTPLVIFMMGCIAVALSWFLPETWWILGALCLIRVSERSLTPTVLNPSFQSLFHPLPKQLSARYQSQAITVAGPFSGALIGLLLIAFNSFFEPNTAVFCVLIATAALVMLWIGRQTSELYPQVLAHAVSSRRIENIEFGAGDKQSLQLLETQLQSELEDEVVYSLTLLNQARPQRLRQHYPALIRHPRATVRQAIVQIIAEELKEEGTPLLQEALQTEDSPAVKATILRAVAENDPENSHEILCPYLEVRHARLLLAALVSLIKYGGLRSILAAGGRLQELERSNVPSERALAAQAIGDIQNPSFYHGLEPLLQDEHLLVRQTALEAAGQLGVPQLLPLTLAKLSEPNLESIALQALSQSGPSSLDALWEAYTQQEQSLRIQRHILVLFGNMKTDESRTKLFDILSQLGGELDEEVLYAMRNAQFQASSNHLEELDRRINLSGKQAIAMLQALENYADATMQGAIFLRETLQHEFEKVIERMLLIACLLTETFPFRRMYESTFLGHKKDIAFYCELIEQTLPGEFSKRLVPLIEPLDRATRIQKLTNIYNQQPADPLTNLTMMANNEFSTRSPWLAVCAARFLDELVRSGSPDTGTHSLHNLHLERKVDRIHAVDFFSACSQAMLAECSSFFQTRQLELDEVLVTKGLPQSSLYIVETGELRSDEEIFREKAYFGEDALVGAELVHEKVYAAAPSTVLVLSREDFILSLEHNLPLYISVLKGLSLQIVQATHYRNERNASGTAHSNESAHSTENLLKKEMLLQGCGLFEHLDRRALQDLLVDSKVITLAPNQELYEPGSAASDLYLVSSGEIELHDDGIVRQRLERGASFGKYSYLGANIPTPTAARSPGGTSVIKISGQAIDNILWSDRQQIEKTVAYLYAQKQVLSTQLTEFTWF